MFYRVEYKVNVNDGNNTTSLNKCYVMMEADSEERLASMIDKDISESISTNMPIVDVDIFEITAEDYLKEQRNHLDAIVMNKYFKSMDEDSKVDFIRYKEMFNSESERGKAYHYYINRLVCESFLQSKINLDDISASSYISYIDRLSKAVNTSDYENIIKEILES